MNLTGLYVGILNLETKILDFEKVRIRPKITDEDVKAYYQECIAKIGKRCKDYFEDQEAFNTVLDETLNGKKPELIARESVYPNPLNLVCSRRLLESILDPNPSITQSRYFYSPHLIIPLPVSRDSPFSKLIDQSKDIVHAPKGAKPRIEIPNDYTLPKAKGATFHETLHYFIIQYQLASGRLFTDRLNFAPTGERALAEKLIHERAVEELTDILLEDDEEALFQDRWVRFQFVNPQSGPELWKTVSISTTLGIGIYCLLADKPQYLPLVIIPAITRRVLLRKYKNSIRKRLIKPVERTLFKI